MSVKVMMVPVLVKMEESVTTRREVTRALVLQVGRALTVRKV